MDREALGSQITQRQVIAQLQGLLSGHWWPVAMIIGLILLASLMEGVSFSLLVPVTQVLTTGSVAVDHLPRVLQAYGEWLAGHRPESQLALLGIALIALFGLKNTLQFARESMAARVCAEVGAATRLKVLSAVLRRPYRYFLDHKQGTLVQSLYQEPHHAASLVQVAIDIGANLFAVVVLSALLFLVSWQVTVIVFMAGAVFGLLTWQLSKLMHAGGRKRKAVDAESMALLTESVAGIRQIKVFSAEERIRTVFESLMRSFQQLHVRYARTLVVPFHVTEMFWIGVLGGLLCLPAVGVIGGIGSVLPAMTVFAAVAFRLGPYVSRLSQGWLTLRFYVPALGVVGQLLDQSKSPLQGTGGRPFTSLSREITFEDVGFSYGGDKPALARVTVGFNRGETTAIVGPSGAGKSTLVDLLIRLYEPTSGRITVDGVDLRKYDRESWLAAIGFVSQDTFVFHGTVRDNIAFAMPGCPLDRIEKAASLANAHAFIERLPDGYETVIGDRGLKLSGGERQRIAIARALLREPQILVFDEATSALDAQSEASVQEAIASIARDRTVLVIAHRLSSVIRADKIIVLENGCVVQEGTHAALVGGGGLYAVLYGKAEE